MVFNTQKGLFNYLHFLFRVAAVLAVFQQDIRMDTILQGLSHVICYLDDMHITDATEHLTNLVTVLCRLSNHGLRLKQDSIENLGHYIDTTGIHTATSKIEAISREPTLKNVSELHYFLGMLNYYGKSIPNLIANYTHNMPY